MLGFEIAWEEAREETVSQLAVDFLMQLLSGK